MTAGRGLPILIVDDHKAMRRVERSLLEQLGFDDIDEAADGDAAFAMMAAKAYGLVLSDWHMAPVSGIDLVRRVRSCSATADLPFIMVSAEARAEQIAIALAAGADDYIIKPITQAALKQKIAAVLGAFA